MRKDLSNKQLALRLGITGIVFVFFLALIVATSYVVNALSIFVSSEGLNVFYLTIGATTYGVHVHKVAVSWLLIGYAVYRRYDKGKWDYISVSLLIVASIIYLYDIWNWQMYLPVTLV